jgi:hypothetical protein
MMNIKNNWHRRVAMSGLTLALVGGATTMDVPAAFADPLPECQYTGRSHFTPVRLIIWDNQDGWFDYTDEPRMYYGGETYATVVRQGGTVYPPPTDFTGSTLAVDIWERDNGWTDNNYLGRIVVSATDLCLERSQQVRGSDYNYELVYRVTSY